MFLVADTQLYKRLCPSVGRLVGWSVHRSVDTSRKVGKRAYPPLPTRPQLVAVYPALFRINLCMKTRSGALVNWSVRVHKALFHLFQFGYSERYCSTYHRFSKLGSFIGWSVRFWSTVSLIGSSVWIVRHFRGQSGCWDASHPSSTLSTALEYQFRSFVQIPISPNRPFDSLHVNVTPQQLRHTLCV